MLSYAFIEYCDIKILHVNWVRPEIGFLLFVKLIIQSMENLVLYWKREKKEKLNNQEKNVGGVLARAGLDLLLFLFCPYSFFVRIFHS